MSPKVRLGDLVQITNGYAFKSSEYIDSGVRVIRITNVQKGSILDNNPQYYPLSSQSTLNRYSINEGDILMSLTGNVGRVGRFPKELLPAYINQRVCRVKSCSAKLNNDYLFYVLNSDLFEREAIENSSGVAQLNLSTKWIEDYEILLPPLAEQQKIAAILDAADSLRQKDQQLVERYAALSQSLFLEMFGDPMMNLMGWDFNEFGQFITVLTDYHANGSYEVLKENVELKSEKDYALMVRTTDLEHNNFDENVVYISQHAYNYLDKSKVFGGEIIISKIGSAGKVFLMPFLNKPVSLGMNAFLLRFDSNLNNLFVYYLLTSKFGEIEVGKRIKGAVTKTIRKDALREIEIPVPPIALQNQFAERIQLIEAQKQQAQSSLEKSESLFNSLLQRAFTGELTAKLVA